nr:hypothetical protein [Tanacetum cinerariifolium]
MPLDDYAAHWANLLGEIVREFPMHFHSWHHIPEEQKAGVLGKIGTQFDLTPHMQSDLWPKIRRLPFGLIPRTLPGVLKMLETGQRARSYTERDPGHLLSSKIGIGSGTGGDDESGDDEDVDEDREDDDS